MRMLTGTTTGRKRNTKHPKQLDKGRIVPRSEWPVEYRITPINQESNDGRKT